MARKAVHLYDRSKTVERLRELLRLARKFRNPRWSDPGSPPVHGAGSWGWRGCGVWCRRGRL